MPSKYVSNLQGMSTTTEAALKTERAHGTNIDLFLDNSKDTAPNNDGTVVASSLVDNSESVQQIGEPKYDGSLTIDESILKSRNEIQK